MKLQFDKSGRRFFFLTFCVRGRRAVLSRIVRKPGKDGRPCTGVELLPTGEAMAALWRGIHARWSFLTASNYIIMPDHLHLLLIVDYHQAQGFDILDWFQHFRREGEDTVAPFLGVAPPFVWEDHFWLLLVNAGRMLAAVRTYIKMNPARKVWKESLTRRMTVAQHVPEIEKMVDQARRGMVPVCGFLSPGEKELERRLRAEPYARWIKTVAHGLPPRFDPTVADSRYLAEGRQLFLSSFPVDVPVFPVNYDNCHLMNARNEALCQRARGEDGQPRPSILLPGGAGAKPPVVVQERKTA